MKVVSKWLSSVKLKAFYISFVHAFRGFPEHCVYSWWKSTNNKSSARKAVRRPTPRTSVRLWGWRTQEKNIPRQEIAEGKADRVPMSDTLHHLQDPDVLQLSGHVEVIKGVWQLWVIGLDAVNKVWSALLKFPCNIRQRFLRREVKHNWFSREDANWQGKAILNRNLYLQSRILLYYASTHLVCVHVCACSLFWSYLSGQNERKSHVKPVQSIQSKQKILKSENFTNPELRCNGGWTSPV